MVKKKKKKKKERKQTNNNKKQTKTKSQKLLRKYRCKIDNKYQKA